MTKNEAIKWIDSLASSLGESAYRNLWDYEQALSEIRQMLGEEQGQEHEQWITCSERLPEESGFYLVTKRQGSGQILMAIGHYSSYGWSGNGNFHDVLAWMPLPEPYKVEGVDG